jgi:hypothetical protein
MPGVAFPPVGRLGLPSPPSAVLCSTKTAPCPSWVASLVTRVPIPCVLPSVRGVPSGLVIGAKLPSHARAFGRPVPLFRELHKETGGSPKFPSYPWRYMPRSQTPVESRRLAKASPGLLPSGSMKPSAFPSGRPEGYPGVHDHKDFGAPSRGLYPRSFQLRTPITGCARGIPY